MSDRNPGNAYLRELYDRQLRRDRTARNNRRHNDIYNGLRERYRQAINVQLPPNPREAQRLDNCNPPRLQRVSPEPPANNYESDSDDADEVEIPDVVEVAIEEAPQPIDPYATDYEDEEDEEIDDVDEIDFHGDDEGEESDDSDIVRLNGQAVDHEEIVGPNPILHRVIDPADLLRSAQDAYTPVFVPEGMPTVYDQYAAQARQQAGMENATLVLIPALMVPSTTQPNYNRLIPLSYNPNANQQH